VSTFLRTSLPNGVRVVRAPMEHVQSTACYVLLQAGSRYEPAEHNGAAHFVEHMLFCGTPRRPTVRALTGEVDAIGGLFNAGTSKEATVYYVKCAGQYATQALDVLADMLRNSLFDASEFDREKGVIVEELRSKLDTPRDYVDEYFEWLVYGDSPLGRLRVGSEETVTGMERETLLDFVGRYYEPSRLVVGIAGRQDDSLLQTVEDLFGDLDGVRAPDPEPAPAANGGARVLLDSKPIDQAHLCLGMRTHPLGHPDRYVVELLAKVLGGGMSSRLNEEIVMQRGLAYTIFATTIAHSDAGSLYAQSGVNVDKVDDALGAIVAEFHRIAEEPVGSDELEKSRNYMKGRFVFSTETPQGLIRGALFDEGLEGAAREPEAVLAAIDAVTAEDIQRAAREALDGGLYLSIVGPFDDADRFERLIA
jgi:predicted Zn-dependent peptidase